MSLMVGFALRCRCALNLATARSNILSTRAIMPCGVEKRGGLRSHNRRVRWGSIAEQKQQDSARNASDQAVNQEISTLTGKKISEQ